MLNLLKKAYERTHGSFLPVTILEQNSQVHRMARLGAADTGVWCRGGRGTAEDGSRDLEEAFTSVQVPA